MAMKLVRHTDGPSSICLTLLKDNDDKDVISTISGVVTTEPRHELLLLAEAESDITVVAVLTVTWLYTTPAYRGHKHGWGLLYQLAATLAPDIQYIVLDDMTDVPAAQGNLFYLMGFQHRQKDPVTNKEFWTAWHPDHPTLGPERLIHVASLKL
jgi:hypothetical protein